jgi:hypothetical protein
MIYEKLQFILDILRPVSGHPPSGHPTYPPANLEPPIAHFTPNFTQFAQNFTQLAPSFQAGQPSTFQAVQPSTFQAGQPLTYGQSPRLVQCKSVQLKVPILVSSDYNAAPLLRLTICRSRWKDGAFYKEGILRLRYFLETSYDHWHTCDFFFVKRFIINFLMINKSSLPDQKSH